MRGCGDEQGENWNEVMYMGVAHTNYWSFLYFLLVTVVGNFIMLNLYLAILLSAFDCGDPPDWSMASLWSVFCGSKSSSSADIDTPTGDIAGWAGSQQTTQDSVDTPSRPSSARPTRESNDIELTRMTRRSRESNESVHTPRSAKGSLTAEINLTRQERLSQNQERVEQELQKALQGKSCYLFGPHNRCRRMLAQVVSDPRFDNAILVLIFLSTIILAVDTPTVDEDSQLAKVLLLLDVVFVLLFTIEMVLKIVVMGLISTPRAYLKDYWNVLDGGIVVISVFNLASELVSLGLGDVNFLRSLRALRALRPLRTIKRAPGLRMAVNTIFATLPAFINIGMVALVVYLAFAIIGVEFFGGKFWSCNDPSVKDVFECVGHFHHDGYRVAREWTNAPIHFDNTAHALLSLYEVAGLELWLDPMYAAMDSPASLGEQPQRGRTPWAALYFVTFILFGSFLVMNLFVGAVVDNFATVSGKENDAGARGLMTDEQKSFVDSVRLVLFRKPISRPRPPPKDARWRQLRQWCYRVVMWGPQDGQGGKVRRDGSNFELLVMSLVVLNMLTMCAYRWEYPPNDEYIALSESENILSLQDSPRNKALDVLNDIYSLLFTIEMILKLLAWGWGQYLQDHWNKLDGFVVVLSDVVFVVDQASTYSRPINPNLVRVLRLVKVMRIMRLLSKGKQVLYLIETLVYSIPAIANVGTLWFLVLFIFSIMGMSLYGSLPTQGRDYPYGLYNDHANFKYFHTAIMTLFRMSTGESWNGIMHDVQSVYPTAWIFFSAYILVVAYLLFNLLVAIVLEQFSMESREDDRFMIGGDVMTCFQEEWAKFDPYATQYITAVQLTIVLRRMPKDICPLGPTASAAAMIRVLRRLRVNVNDQGQVHFAESFIALIQLAYNCEIEKQQKRVEQGDELSDHDLCNVSVLEGILQQIIAHYPALSRQSEHPRPIVDWFCASLVQAHVKTYAARKKWLEIVEDLREQKHWRDQARRNRDNAAAAAAAAAVLDSTTWEEDLHNRKARHRHKRRDEDTAEARLARRIDDVPAVPHATLAPGRGVGGFPRTEHPPPSRAASRGSTL